MEGNILSCAGSFFYGSIRSSVWGQIIPQSFVIPAEWKSLKQYLDGKYDGQIYQASI